MRYYLAKTEPAEYSINDLEKDGTATWDGVRNPQAVMALKSMQPKDRVLIYHSGDQKAIIGLAEVVGNSRPDAKDDRSWLVDFKFLTKFNPPYITLGQIKTSGLFNDFKLVKQGRLSTMEVPTNFIDWLKQQGLDL